MEKVADAPYHFGVELTGEKALPTGGWRGLLALCLLLMTCATIVSSGSGLFKPLRDSFVIDHFPTSACLARWRWDEGTTARHKQRNSAKPGGYHR
jgi:hypothetical protein